MSAAPDRQGSDEFYEHFGCLYPRFDGLTPCPRCDTTWGEGRATPELIHFGRVDCGGCGTFRKWIPKPKSTKETRR